MDLDSFFALKFALRTLKNAILMILSSFFFTCKESFRFLIFNTLFRSFRQLERRKHDIRHGKIRKFGLVAAFQRLKFSSQNIILSSKTLLLLIQAAFLRSNRLRERLKLNFDDSELIFFHLPRKFQVSHFNTLFRSFRQLERRKHDIRQGKIRNFGLVAALQVLSLALKTSF